MTSRELKVRAAGWIENRVDQSEVLLKRAGFDPETYQRLCLNTLLKYPKLAECSQRSLELAILRCIEVGLVPDGEEAAIVPFKVKGTPTATLIPMIAGRRRLARIATPGLVLRDNAVFEDDEWEYEEGLYPVLRHVPKEDADRSPACIVATYAVAMVPGAEAPEFRWMFRNEIDARMAKSPGAKKADSPWKQHFEEMARKTAMGQVLKRLPKRAGQPEPPEDDEMLAQGFDLEYEAKAEPEPEDDDIEEAEVVGDEAPPPEEPPAKVTTKAADPEPAPDPDEEPWPEPPEPAKPAASSSQGAFSDPNDDPF